MHEPAPHAAPGSSLYEQSMHELARLLGLDPQAVAENASIEADGVRFHFQRDRQDEEQSLDVLAEIGEIPLDDDPKVLRQLLEANSHLSVRAGTYALIPGTSRAALRVQVALVEGASNGERILAVLQQHVATCTAVRHLGTGPLVGHEADAVPAVKV